MSSKFDTTIPLDIGLTHAKCERGQVDQLGGPPPLRLLPESVAERDDYKTVKKEINGSKVTIPLFDGKDANCEMAIKHIQTFENLAEQLGYKREAASARELKKAAEDLIAKYNDPADPADGTVDDDREIEGQEVTKTKLEWAQLDLKAMDELAKLYVKSYWQLWEDLLDPSLLSKWRTIVKLECETKGYVTKGGKKKNGKRGTKTFLAHWHCRRTWLKTIVAGNAAERNRQYLSAQIKMPSELDIANFVDRVWEIGELSPYLPCWKDEEGSPSKLPRADEPIDEITMCMWILNAIPFHLAAAYWQMKGAKHCPTDVQQLKTDLILVEPQARQLATVIRQMNQNNKKKNKGKGAETAESADASSKSGKGGKGSPAKSSGKEKANGTRKLCNRCAQWSAYLKHTHNTLDCRKWEADGTEKTGKRKRESNALTKELEEMKMNFATLQQDRAKDRQTIKKMAKQLKKQEADSDDDY